MQPRYWLKQEEKETKKKEKEKKEQWARDRDWYTSTSGHQIQWEIVGIVETGGGRVEPTN